MFPLYQRLRYFKEIQNQLDDGITDSSPLSLDNIDASIVSVLNDYIQNPVVQYCLSYMKNHSDSHQLPNDLLLHYDVLSSHYRNPLSIIQKNELPEIDSLNELVTLEKEDSFLKSLFPRVARNYHFDKDSIRYQCKVIQEAYHEYSANFLDPK